MHEAKVEKQWERSKSSAEALLGIKGVDEGVFEKCFILSATHEIVSDKLQALCNLGLRKLWLKTCEA